MESEKQGAAGDPLYWSHEEIAKEPTSHALENSLQAQNSQRIKLCGGCRAAEGAGQHRGRTWSPWRESPLQSEIRWGGRPPERATVEVRLKEQAVWASGEHLAPGSGQRQGPESWVCLAGMPAGLESRPGKRESRDRRLGRKPAEKGEVRTRRRRPCKPLQRTLVLLWGRNEDAGGIWTRWYDLSFKTVSVATELRKILKPKEDQLRSMWNNQERWWWLQPGWQRRKVAGRSWIRDPLWRAGSGFADGTTGRQEREGS